MNSRDWVRLTFVAAAIVTVALLAACSGGDDGPIEPPTNTPPTIALQFSKIGVVRSSTTQLSVSVNDLDDDPLTVTWSVTRGSITSLNSANTLVQWNVPATVGVDSVYVEVSDGTASRSTAVQIKVGWPLNTSNAPGTLLKSQSPYIVTVTGNPPRLIVADAQTVIEPGTELLLETAGMVIDVSDTLVVVGNPAEPIVIRPNLNNLTCGDDRGWWQGINVANNISDPGYLEMDNAHIWYGQWGVRLREQGTAVIRNSELRCSGNNGVLHEGSGVLLIDNTEIRDGKLDGIGVDAITFVPDSLIVSDCHIAFNGRTGIAMNLQDQFGDADIVIEYSNIEFNSEHGVTLMNAVFPSFHYNRFFGNGVGSTNGLNHIWLFSGFAAGSSITTVDATCNFWGAPVTNLATIDATIRDSLDTATVGARVIASPWSNENPLVTTSTCVVP